MSLTCPNCDGPAITQPGDYVCMKCRRVMDDAFGIPPTEVYQRAEQVNRDQMNRAIDYLGNYVSAMEKCGQSGRKTVAILKEFGYPQGFTGA